MRPVDQAKITILVVAIAVWGWGAKTGNRTVMLVGISLVIVAFALRLFPKSQDRDGH